MKRKFALNLLQWFKFGKPRVRLNIFKKLG
jgi:hypothetical protein